METFFGYVHSTEDAYLLFESCMARVLPMVPRRLTVAERRLIRNGSIFVFDEEASNVRRWTDGRLWSSSRIDGGFLVYSERQRVRNENGSSGGTTSSEPTSPVKSELPELTVSTYRGVFQHVPDGLIKKTLSMEVRGRKLHLINYFSKNKYLQNQLPKPSQSPALSAVTISDEDLLKRLQAQRENDGCTRRRTSHIQPYHGLSASMRRPDYIYRPIVTTKEYGSSPPPSLPPSPTSNTSQSNITSMYVSETSPNHSQSNVVSHNQPSNVGLKLPGIHVFDRLSYAGMSALSDVASRMPQFRP